LRKDTTAILKQINSPQDIGPVDYLSMQVTSVLKVADLIFGKPYIEDGDTRTFDVDKSQDEYVWHRDREDRHIEVIAGAGWRFQPENCLPFLLQPGLEFDIKKNEYHRLIKGESDLKIKITRLL
jgi:hypothetical protein